MARRGGPAVVNKCTLYFYGEMGVLSTKKVLSVSTPIASTRATFPVGFFFFASELDAAEMVVAGIAPLATAK